MNSKGNKFLEGNYFKINENIQQKDSEYCSENCRKEPLKNRLSLKSKHLLTKEKQCTANEFQRQVGSYY